MRSKVDLDYCRLRPVDVVLLVLRAFTRWVLIRYWLLGVSLAIFMMNCIIIIYETVGSKLNEVVFGFNIF